MSDIDAQLQGGGGYDSFQASFLEPLLGSMTTSMGEAAMMGEDLVLTKPLGQLMSDAFRQFAGIDEDERAAVFLDELHEPFVDFGPVLVGANGLQLLPGHFDGQVHVAEVADIDHDRCVRTADKELGKVFKRFLRRGQADADWTCCTQSFEPLQ